jgi:glycosyltransferase involved in cell wall biosynthesis
VSSTDQGVIYQFNLGSVLVGGLLSGASPFAVDYHNVTPAEIVRRWEPDVAAGLEWGHQQLRELAPRAVLGIGDSSFNVSDLDAAGFRESVVAPILFDVGEFDVVPDGSVVAGLSGGGGATWLFVGRLAPNKAQHDVVRAFAFYRRVFDPGARLFLVGGSSSDRYERALVALVDELGLGSSVVLTGAVSDAELAAYYAGADVFVCLSDHEGFCVPLLESMFHRLPVVAFGSSAVPETLGSGGLCLPEKSPALVASAVWRVVSDPVVREGLVEAGTIRLGDFDLSRTRATFTHAIERFIELAEDRPAGR